MFDSARTVLLVEDEPLVRRTTAELLADDGYRVLEAASFDEALEQLGTCPDVAALGHGYRHRRRAGRDRADPRPSASAARTSGSCWFRAACAPAAINIPPTPIFFTKPYAPSALLTIIRQSIEGELEPRAPALELDGALT
jgi:hypothetical protein